RGVKSRGLVAGGRSKPWRQKGTGRARAGSTRAPNWTGGGVAFAVRSNFVGKVNRKERKAAFRAALSAHADEGTFAVLADNSFDEPSTQDAAAIVEAWGKQAPLIVVAQEDQTAISKSFRNLDGVQVVTPAEVEISALVWARSLLISEAALELVQGRASCGCIPTTSCSRRQSRRRATSRSRATTAIRSVSTRTGTRRRAGRP